MFKDGFQLVARKDSRWRRKVATTADLKDADLLLLAGGPLLREHALAACRLPQADSGFAGASLNALVEMVAGGLGVTLLPDMACRCVPKRAAGGAAV
jgi:LysR family hydrogen peroxide-inducible transcriptional activator